MKQKIKFLFLILISTTTTFAQTPKIALERPSTNTTQIFETLQDAYDNAINNDIIYLPGGIFSINDTIKKNVQFYGTGINPDSCLTTGITIIRAWIRVFSNGTGPTFEGIKFSYPSYNGNQPDLIHLSNSSAMFNYCEIPMIKGGNNCLIKNSIIGGLYAINNSTIQNSIISYVGYFNYYSSGADFASNCTFKNNFFTGYDSSHSFVFVYNSNFYNNIFLAPYAISHSNDQIILVNNLKNTSTSLVANGGFETNSIVETNTNNIFINYSSLNPNFYFSNLELKSTSAGKNAGSDGTDVGIYGGSFPCTKGWVPSNPHIFYKQVATQTLPNGKLQVHYRVRKGN